MLSLLMDTNAKPILLCTELSLCGLKFRSDHLIINRPSVLRGDISCETKFPFKIKALALSPYYRPDPACCVPATVYVPVSQLLDF